MTYPFHINPDTNRANKCYKVDRCRFGIAVDDHYTTAAEALAVRDERAAALDVQAATKVFAVKHDARISELVNQYNGLYAGAVKNARKLVSRLGMKNSSKLTLKEILAKAEGSQDVKGVKTALAATNEALAAATELRAKIDDLDKVYTGWTRWYDAPGGNIHSNGGCATLKHTWDNPAPLNWLTEHSGKTQEEVANEIGARLCTTCFVEAPAELTDHYAKAEAKARVTCGGSGTKNFFKVPKEADADGNDYGECKVCHKQITVTALGVLRTHKPAVVAAKAKADKPAPKAEAPKAEEVTPKVRKPRGRPSNKAKALAAAEAAAAAAEAEVVTETKVLETAGA